MLDDKWCGSGKQWGTERHDRQDIAGTSTAKQPTNQRSNWGGDLRETQFDTLSLLAIPAFPNCWLANRNLKLEREFANANGFLAV
jgi:hypothetical protein